MPPTLKQRLWTGLKSLGRMRFSGYGGGGGLRYVAGMWWPFGTLPGSNADIAQYVGDPAQNSAVSILLNWIADQLPEPELRVLEVGQGENGQAVQTAVPDHPLVRLLSEPNPFYDGDALWAATSVSYNVSGNAYWIKARNYQGYGVPVELYWAPHWRVQPRWNQNDPYSFITHYDYLVDGEVTRLEVEDVVHFRFGLDPVTMGRLGVSRLYPVLRSVMADNEVQTYIAAILHNMGMPGVVMMPEVESDTIGPEGREELKAMWTGQTTGDNRGKPIVASRKVKIENLAFNPNELALDKMAQIPEDRICAALRVPGMVAGLTSGAAHKTYANYKEAREAAYEDCIIPMQGRFAKTLQRHLLPDFEKDSRRLVRFGYENVRCLQEDQDALVKRWTLAYRGGLARLNEARSKINLPPEKGPAGEGYYQPRAAALPDAATDPRNDPTGAAA